MLTRALGVLVGLVAAAFFCYGEIPRDEVRYKVVKSETVQTTVDRRQVNVEVECIAVELPSSRIPELVVRCPDVSKGALQSSLKLDANSFVMAMYGEDDFSNKIVGGGFFTEGEFTIFTGKKVQNRGHYFVTAKVLAFVMRATPSAQEE